MRVFHLISHFDMGGAERVAAAIARSRTPGVEYHVVEMMRGRSAFTARFIAELEAAGVRCHRGWMPDIRFHFVLERLTALLFPLWFLPLFVRHRPDVVHAHTELPDMCTVAFFKLFPGMLRRCRVVRTIHNTQLWTGQHVIGRVVERFYGRHAVNIAISPAVAERYVAVYGGPTPTVIYNGVEPAEQKAYDGIVAGRINILFCGRFEKQKGIDALISTVAALDGDERYHFHIIGDGSLRGEIEQRLLGQTNVSLRPPLFGLSAYLGSFDYMFMPSEFEGLSIVAIEAAMAGLPNIISDCPGLRETLPADWPLKVADGDYLRIFREVLPGLDGAAAAIGRRAHDYVAARFSVDTMRRSYEAVYHRSRA